MNYTKFIIIVGFFIFSLACSKSKTDAEIQKDWTMLDTEEYTIKYPHTWLLNNTGYMGTSFLLISKQTSIRDFYQENVKLVKDTLESNSIGLEKYVQNEMSRLKKEFPNFKILQGPFETEIDTSKMTLSYTGSEENMHVFIESQYQLKDSIVYQLTFSSKYRELKRYKPTGEGILKSFSLK